MGTIGIQRIYRICVKRQWRAVRRPSPCLGRASASASESLFSGPPPLYLLKRRLDQMIDPGPLGVLEFWGLGKEAPNPLTMCFWPHEHAMKVPGNESTSECRPSLCLWFPDVLYSPASPHSAFSNSLKIWAGSSCQLVHWPCFFLGICLQGEIRACASSLFRGTFYLILAMLQELWPQLSSMFN